MLGKLYDIICVDFYEGEYLRGKDGNTVWPVHPKDLRIFDLGGYSRCIGKGE